MLLKTPPHSSENLSLALPGGRVLGYAEYGAPDGVPLIGFHGTPGSRFMFRIAHRQAAALGLRLVAPERPGFGLSTYDRGFTLSSYAADVAAFADALGIGRFAVAGVSGGAPYATACAALMPERVTALAAVSPVGPMAKGEGPRSIGPGHYFAFRIAPRVVPFLASILTIGRFAFLYTPGAMAGFIISRSTPSDWKIISRREVRRNLLQGVSEGVRPGIRGALREMRLFSGRWNLPFGDIKAPAFLWQGTADRNVPAAAALRLGELIPGCQVTRVEKGGHYWIFDNIETVLGTIAGAVRGAETP
jgi:pimeloyl-ACP methyl ester carboxylesterase